MKKTMTGLLVAAAVASLSANRADAELICAPVICVKSVRDVGVGVPKVYDGLGDGTGLHNSPDPQTGNYLTDNRVTSIVFQLPDLAGGTLTGASLSSVLADNTAQGFNLDVVVTKVDPDFHPEFSDYEGAIGLLGTSQQIADDLATPSTPAGALPTISGGNLLAFLLSNYSAGEYVHISLVPDALDVDATQRLTGFYQVLSPYSAVTPMQLCLTIERVPEPTVAALSISALAAVGVARRRCRQS